MEERSLAGGAARGAVNAASSAQMIDILFGSTSGPAWATPAAQQSEGGETK
jgi:hypothetical protein